MPAPRPVTDREAVKMLALEIGLRPAARQLNIPIGTLSYWSTQGKWFDPPEHKLPPTMKRIETVQTKPSEVLQTLISERKIKTRSRMSKYVSDAAARLEQSKGNLKLSRAAKDIADVAGKVWPEQAGTGTGGININVLTGAAAFYVEE